MLRGEVMLCSPFMISISCVSFSLVLVTSFDTLRIFRNICICDDVVILVLVFSVCEMSSGSLLDSIHTAGNQYPESTVRLAFIIIIIVSPLRITHTRDNCGLPAFSPSLFLSYIQIQSHWIVFGQKIYCHMEHQCLNHYTIFACFERIYELCHIESSSIIQKKIKVILCICKDMMLYAVVLV